MDFEECAHKTLSYEYFRLMKEIDDMEKSGEKYSNLWVSRTKHLESVIRALKNLGKEVLNATEQRSS